MMMLREIERERQDGARRHRVITVPPLPDAIIAKSMQPAAGLQHIYFLPNVTPSQARNKKGFPLSVLGENFKNIAASEELQNQNK